MWTDVDWEKSILRVERRLPAAWLAGVLATALFGIGVAVSFLSNGDLPGLAGWVGRLSSSPPWHWLWASSPPAAGSLRWFS